MWLKLVGNKYSLQASRAQKGRLQQGLLYSCSVPLHTYSPKNHFPFVGRRKEKVRSIEENAILLEIRQEGEIIPSNNESYIFRNKEEL
jgi:hypothetical protein